jgi:ribose transport system substrate-binding protein
MEVVPMKKVLALMMVLLLVTPSFSAATAEKQKYVIAVNLKTLSSEYWQVVKGGIDKAAAELGLTIDVQGASAETEIAEQVAQLETQLAQNPDAMIIAPLDSDAVVGAIQAAGYKGKVVFCDTDCAYADKTAFVGTSNEDAAYAGGVYGIAINGKDTMTLIIYGQEGDNTSNLRRAGFKRALEEAGLEPVAELSGNNTTDGGQKAMEDQLIAHPEINLVLCHNDDIAIGALNAIKAAGAAVSIIGFNGDAAAVDIIAKGDKNFIGTVAQQPALMGYQSVKTAVAALDGEQVAVDQPVDTVIIDASNVADYVK